MFNNLRQDGRLNSEILLVHVVRGSTVIPSEVGLVEWLVWTVGAQKGEMTLGKNRDTSVLPLLYLDTKKDRPRLLQAGQTVEGLSNGPKISIQGSVFDVHILL